MMSPGAKAACLSIGLATAWAPIAEADVMTRVRVENSTPTALSHAFLLMGSPGSGAPGVMMSNVGFSYGTPDFILDQRAPSDFGSGYAMIAVTGIGSGAPPGGVLGLVVSAPGLTYIGSFFEQAFPGWSEPQLIDQMMHGGPLPEMFLRTNFAVLMQGLGQTATCTKFSQGEAFGTMHVSIEAVPAPAALAVLPMGLFALRRRRR